MRAMKAKLHSERLAIGLRIDDTLQAKIETTLSQLTTYESFTTQCTNKSSELVASANKLRERGFDVPEGMFTDQANLTRLEATKLYRAVLTDIRADQ